MMNKTIDLMNNTIKSKIYGETQIFNISDFDVDTSRYTEIKILEDDYKYYINYRTGEKIAIYKGSENT